MRAIQLTVACIAGLVATAGQVQAGLIVAPVTATSDVAGLLSTATATIDQSGLSSTYVSGVTDFDTFVTSGVTAGGRFTDFFIPRPDNHLSLLTYGFGSSISIESIAVWNNSQSQTGGIDAISGFQLFADDDAIFGNGTTGNLGSFSMAAISFPAEVEVFAFAPVSTPFVHLRITGTQAGQRPGINEVAFETATAAAVVPEPSSLALFGIGAGIAAVGAARRRRREKQQQAPAA